MVCTAALVSSAISGALQQLFGYIGGAVLFEVVDADAASGRAKVLLDQRCTPPHWNVLACRASSAPFEVQGGAHWRQCDRRDVQKVQAAAACFAALGGAPASLGVTGCCKL